MGDCTVSRSILEDLEYLRELLLAGRPSTPDRGQRIFVSVDPGMSTAYIVVAWRESTGGPIHVSKGVNNGASR